VDAVFPGVVPPEAKGTREEAELPVVSVTVTLPPVLGAEKRIVALPLVADFVDTVVAPTLVVRIVPGIDANPVANSTTEVPAGAVLGYGSLMRG
jgi:hypothetical protein